MQPYSKITPSVEDTGSEDNYKLNLVLGRQAAAKLQNLGDLRFGSAGHVDNSEF
jgi:hypothetical protein